MLWGNKGEAACCYSISAFNLIVLLRLYYSQNVPSVWGETIQVVASFCLSFLSSPLPLFLYCVSNGLRKRTSPPLCIYSFPLLLPLHDITTYFYVCLSSSIQIFLDVPFSFILSCFFFPVWGCPTLSSSPSPCLTGYLRILTLCRWFSFCLLDGLCDAFKKLNCRAKEFDPLSREPSAGKDLFKSTWIVAMYKPRAAEQKQMDYLSVLFISACWKFCLFLPECSISTFFRSSLETEIIIIC